jgi:hypothetical protein
MTGKGASCEDIRETWTLDEVGEGGAERDRCLAGEQRRMERPDLN